MAISRQSARSRLKKKIVAVLWIVTAVGLGVFFLLDNESLAVIGGIAGFAYIVAFIWYLSATRPFAEDLPSQEKWILPRLGFWPMAILIIVIVVILLIIGLAIHPAFVLMLVSSLIALGCVVVQRHQLNRQLVVCGLAAGLVTGLTIQFLGTGDPTWAAFNLVTVALLFVGGGLLQNRTGLGCIRFLERQYGRGIGSFLWGCVLAVPPALFNLLGNVQQGDRWVVHWWQPLSALAAGVGEEVWARLFVTTLCYALLRPTTNERPRRALAAVILIGAIVHGFAHTGFDPVAVLVGSLMYGVPLALLYIKRDFEQAVGYHFLIDFVRFGAALLQG